MAYIEFNKLVSRLCCLFTWKIPHSEYAAGPSYCSPVRKAQGENKLSPKTWKKWKKIFFWCFICFLYVFCLFFFVCCFCLGSRMGHQFCPGLTQVGFVTLYVFKCPPSRLQKSQNSAGSAYPKHPRAACAAQRRKNLREKRQGKEIGEKFCDSRSAFFQELCSKYSSVSWPRLQTKFPKIIWVPFFLRWNSWYSFGCQLLSFRFPPHSTATCATFATTSTDPVSQLHLSVPSFFEKNTCTNTMKYHIFLGWNVGYIIT